MVMCWASDCKHYNIRETCKFFKFPTEAATRKLWKKLIGRDVEPGSGGFVCSCHFKDGKRENGPTLFLHNENKRFVFTSPEKRKQKIASVEEAFIETEELQKKACESIPAEPPVTEEETLTEEVPAKPKEVEPQPSTCRYSDATTSVNLPMFSPSADAENYFLRTDLEEITAKQEHLSQNFSYNHIKNNKLILLYTGLPSNAIFCSLFNLLKDIQINYYLKWKVEKLSKEDQLLMKLRQNFRQEDLAVRFNMSQAAVSNIILTWLHLVHEILFKQLMAEISSREKKKLCLPSCNINKFTISFDKRSTAVLLRH